MRVLIGIFVAAVLAWGGYWFLGANATEKALAAWFGERRAEGWVAEYASLETLGFPNRFDTTVSGLELADPDTGVAWSAPFFQILSLSYKPNHVILVWPDRQSFSTPDRQTSVTAGDMRGSAVFDIGPTLPLDRLVIEMEAMGFAGSDGALASLAQGQLALRRAEGESLLYDIHFQATGYTPSARFLQRLEGGTLLSDVFDGMSIDMQVRFDAPWDRYAIERTRPQIRSLDLRLLKAEWGQLDLWAAGSVEVDAEGIPIGEITIKAKNWPEMVEIARASGALPEALVGTVTGALKFLSSLSGDPETLDIPLGMKRGLVSLGPIPIAAAPRLVIP
jgi:hypothetical protein